MLTSMFLHMLFLLRGMLSKLELSQKDSQRQGFKCKSFLWEVIPGWRIDKGDREGKEANK